MTNQPTDKPRPGRKTLAVIVGIPVAIALGLSIPADESGRKVSVSVDTVTQELRVTHISGRQYLKAYLDIVNVPTACDGLTRDSQGRAIKIRQRFTEQQCALMLEDALVAHAGPVMACTPGIAISNDPKIEKVRQGPRFAAVSLAYNVGTDAYCKSTPRRMFNAHQYNSGCNALLKWNKSGGRVVQGLSNRRQRERAICLNGLSA